MGPPNKTPLAETYFYKSYALKIRPQITSLILVEVALLLLFGALSPLLLDSLNTMSGLFTLAVVLGILALAAMPTISAILNRSQGLVLSRDGVENRTFGPFAGKIAWADIENYQFRLRDYSTWLVQEGPRPVFWRRPSSFITLVVPSYPQRNLRQLGFISKLFAIFAYGPQTRLVMISLPALQGAPDQIVEDFRRAYDFHRPKLPSPDAR